MIDQNLGGEKKLTATLLSRKPTPLSSTVVLLCAVVISAVTLIGWIRPSFGELLPVSGEAVFQRHEWWRIWSACLAHADIAHLASNLLLFVILGRFLGGYFGYWLFPFWAFFLGGLANLIVLPSYPPDVSVLGASGWVNVLGGLWLALFFGISRQYRMAGRWLRTLGVGLLLFAPQEFRPQVAERVHMAGLVAGIIFGAGWFFRHRAEFRRAEVWTAIPPEDPADALPPVEGVPRSESVGGSSRG